MNIITNLTTTLTMLLSSLFFLFLSFVHVFPLERETGSWGKDKVGMVMEMGHR